MVEKTMGSSAEIRAAIHGALHEERNPSWKRYLKSALWALFFTIILAVPFPFVLGELSSNILIFYFGSLFGVFFSWFLFYFKPQPRLLVRGYWSQWVVGRVGVLATSIAVLQFLLCPHLVLKHFSGGTALPWMNGLAVFYDGLSGPLFGAVLCGITFGLVASVVTFLLLPIPFLRLKWAHWPKAVATLAMAQTPAYLIQFFDPHLRMDGLFMCLGSIGAIVVFAAFAVLAGSVGEKLRRPAPK